MKFSGEVGFGFETETTPGVWEYIVTEKHYVGDLNRFGVSYSTADKVNSDRTLSNEASIVADSYAREHYGFIIYVRLCGVTWNVTSITQEYPRLKLSFGGVYNGKQASTAGGT